jgi:hypothetical protein
MRCLSVCVGLRSIIYISQLSKSVNQSTSGRIHLQVVVQSLQNNFAGYPRREGSDSRENGSRHGEFSS